MWNSSELKIVSICNTGEGVDTIVLIMTDVEGELQPGLEASPLVEADKLMPNALVTD